mmetsp:Transcript_11392/g.23346  ORF Transcript_11392/g.23346 Transcript_11392/m.23346 type:complete len:260 (-) Transcript_11392:267-1046(-)
MDSSPEQCEAALMYSEYDHEYEKQGHLETKWVGDGDFVDQTWLLGDGSSGAEITLAKERPTMLYTCVRWPSGPYQGKSMAHSNHPMVALVHLLSNADRGSDVFMSVPFLSDFNVIDQLCRYANPDESGLNIYILLGPSFWNKSNLCDFVGFLENRRQAVARLHIKDCGHDRKYFHTKAVVSTAGMMIGSYNYTKASREEHYEHAVLFGPDFHALDGLRQELSDEWKRLGPEIDIPKKEAQAFPDNDAVSNPYRKRANRN